MRLSLRPALCAAVVGAALLLVACGGGSKKNESRAGVTGLASATPAASSETATVPASATQSAGLPTPKQGTILEKIEIPSIKLDSPVETLGLNARGEMEDPSGKDAVAWYNFSEFPGFGGNAVFSGHVDWFTGELGSFGRMKDLKDGDEIIVHMSDGFEMKYKVSMSKLYEADKAPINEIVGKTEKDSLTFITCEGTFNRSTGNYSHRRVVRAERYA